MYFIVHAHLLGHFADIIVFVFFYLLLLYFINSSFHNILQNTITIRIHLDDTTSENGALRVIPTSHLKEIYRPETTDWKKETESSCEVNKGGVMLMKPLILHASSRTTNGKQRRVIHLEFCNQDLKSPLNWLEKLNIA